MSSEVALHSTQTSCSRPAVVVPAVVLAVSLVALATLATLQLHFGYLQNISTYVLLCPVGGVALISAVALTILGCRRGQRGEASYDPSVLSELSFTPAPAPQNEAVPSQGKKKRSFLDLTSETCAQTVGFLFLTDHLRQEPQKSFSLNVRSSISFLKPTLEKAKDLVTEEELPQFERFLENLGFAYEADKKMLQIQKQKKTEKEYEEARGQFVDWVLSSLEARGELFLPVGFAGDKVGHHVLLHLKQNETGQISGSLINSGLGLRYHPGTRVNEREERKYCELFFKSTDRWALKTSDTLGLLLDLQISQQRGARRKCGNTIADLYEVVVPTWPKGHFFDTETGLCVAPQRSGTCTAMPFLTALMRWVDCSSLHLHLRLAATKHVLKHGNLDSYSMSQFKKAWKYTARMAEEMRVSKTLCDKLEKRFESCKAKIEAYSATPDPVALDLCGEVDPSKEVHFEDSPPLGGGEGAQSKIDYTDLDKVIAAATVAAEESRSRARFMVEMALEKLPEANEVCQATSSQLLKLCNRISLWEAGEARIAPRETALLLKAYALAMRAVAKDANAHEMVAFFATNVLQFLPKDAEMHFTTPAQARTFLLAKKVIKEQAKLYKIDLEAFGLRLWGESPHYLSYKNFRKSSLDSLNPHHPLVRFLNSRGVESEKLYDSFDTGWGWSRYRTRLPKVESFFDLQRFLTFTYFFVSPTKMVHKEQLDSHAFFSSSGTIGYDDTTRSKQSRDLSTFYELTDEQASQVAHVVKRDDLQNGQLRYRDPIALGDGQLAGISAQELYAVCNYPELRIPQLIQFYEKHLPLLAQVEHQAIFCHHLFGCHEDQAFLSWVGEKQPQQLELLIKFLCDSFDKTSGDLPLFLLRTMVQVSSFLSDNDLLDNVESILLGLPHEDQQINHTLVSLQPYFQNGPLAHLEWLCLRACKSGTEFDPKEQRLLAYDYESARFRFSSQQSETSLPLWVVTHNDYIFPSTYPCEKTRNGFEFVTDAGVRYRIKLKEKSFSTFRFIEGQWYERKALGPQIQEAFEEKHPASQGGVFAREVHFWEKDGHVVATNSEEQILYTIEEGKICHPTRRDLVLVDEYANLPIAQLISRLISTSEILVWQKEQTLVRVEVPALDLVFTQVKGEWRCPRFSNLRIDPNPVAQRFAPLDHYLVLRSSKRRVVLLRNRILSNEEQPALFKPVATKQSDVPEPDLYSYRLEEKLPTDAHHTVYLAYLMLQKKDYAYARLLIDQIAQTVYTLDETMCSWIDDLIQNRDTNPLATALRLRLYFLRCQRGEVAVPKEWKKVHLEDWEAYAQERDNHFCYELSLLEEKTLTLAPPQGLISQEKLNDQGNLTSYFTPDVIRKMVDVNPLPIGLRMRPSRNMLLNLPYYRKHLSSNEVKELIAFSAYSPDPAIQMTRRLLVHLKENPGVELDWEKTGELDLGAAPLPAAWSYPERTEVKENPVLRVERIERGNPCAYEPEIFASIEDLHSHFEDGDVSTDQSLYELDAKTMAAAMARQAGKTKKEQPLIARELRSVVKGIAKLVEDQDWKAKAQRVKGEAAFRNDLAKRKTQISGEEARLREEIEEMATDYSKEDRFKAEGGMYESLSLEELVLYFGTGQDYRITNSNPKLSGETLSALKTKLHAYLLTATELKHLEKVEDAEKPFSLLTQIRVYDPKEQPYFLVFEYFAKMRIRKEQYEALSDLVGTDKKIDFEARTGFGKSSVLIPLWLFMKSLKEENFSTMVVPGSLFVQQLHQLRFVLGRAFGKLVTPVIFDRTQASDPRYLKNLAIQMQEAHASQRVVLTTIQSIHGLCNLKYKELLYNACAEETWEAYITIRKLLLKSSCFFDESKICFNIRHHYDYAVGNKVPCESRLLDATTRLYEGLFVKDRFYNVNFLPREEEFEYPDEMSYTEMRKTFADHVCTLLPSQDEAIKADLQGTPSEEASAIITGWTPEMRYFYAHCKEQLLLYWKSALFKKCGDDYTLTGQSRIAIPAFNGIPKKNSEFSSVVDLLNFTIQANLRIPFTHFQIGEFLAECQMRYVKQLRDDPFLTFYAKLNLPVDPRDDIDLKALIDRINEDRSLRLEFTRLTVLPQITLYPKKIVSNAFPLIHLLRFQAASGTVNPDVLPADVKTMPNQAALVRNLFRWWRDSRTDIHRIADPLTALYTQKAGARAFIDVGGLLDGDHEEFATKILENMDVQGVLFFDAAGVAWVKEHPKQPAKPYAETELEAEQIFYLFRKSKVVGTDLKMPTDTHAVLTVGRNTARDIFLQGMGRLREMEKGQTLSIFVPNDDKEIVFSDRTRDEWLNLMLHLETKRCTAKAQDNFEVVHLFFKSLFDRAFYDFANSIDHDHEQMLEAFAHFEPHVVEETNHDPLDILPVEIRQRDTQTVLKELFKVHKERLAAFLEEHDQYAEFFNEVKIKEGFETHAAADRHSKTNEKQHAIQLATVEAEVSHNRFKRAISGDVATTEAEAHRLARRRANGGVAMVDADSLAQNMNQADQQSQAQNLADQSLQSNPLHFTPLKPKEIDNPLSLLRESRRTPPIQIGSFLVFPSPNYRLVAKEKVNVQKPAFEIALRKVDSENQLFLLDQYDAHVLLKHYAPSNTFLLSGSRILGQGYDCGNFDKVYNRGERLLIGLIQKVFTAYPLLSEDEEEYLRGNAVEARGLLEQIERLEGAWSYISHLRENIRKCLE